MLELVRYVKGSELEGYRNCFLNLGLSIMMFSEPGPANKTTIKPGLTFSQWDMWKVQGNAGFTLQDFVKYFEVREFAKLEKFKNSLKFGHKFCQKFVKKKDQNIHLSDQFPSKLQRFPSKSTISQNDIPKFHIFSHR